MSWTWVGACLRTPGRKFLRVVCWMTVEPIEQTETTHSEQTNENKNARLQITHTRPGKLSQALWLAICLGLRLRVCVLFNFPL